MKARAAIIRQAPGTWEIAELDLDEPRQDELVIKMVATGLCHSDEHVAQGDLPARFYPAVGGHEGAGIVHQVGPHTPGWEVGDHVVLSFLPGCGRCRFCSMGHQNLCDNGALTMQGSRLDGSYRMHLDGAPVSQLAGISTFSNYSVVSTLSAVKVDKDLPLETICLTGCGVGTGWGSAVNSAEVTPGDCVIVMGIGGIGINAVQGAAHAGATTLIAVDPLEFKREMALKLGATHAFATMDEGADFARSVTNGQGADSAIICVGVTNGDHIAEGFEAIRKAGTVVATGVGNYEDKGINISPTQLTLFQKRIQGSLFGASNPSKDIPMMLAQYRAGRLRLDELVTRTYKLDEIQKGYADMYAGINMRGVVIHEH